MYCRLSDFFFFPCLECQQRACADRMLARSAFTSGGTTIGKLSCPTSTQTFKSDSRKMSISRIMCTGCCWVKHFLYKKLYAQTLKYFPSCKKSIHGKVTFWLAQYIWHSFFCCSWRLNLFWNVFQDAPLSFACCTQVHTSPAKKKGGAGGFRQDNNFYVHSSCVHPCTWNYPPNRKKGDQGRNDGRKNHLRCSRSVGHFCWEIPRGVGTDLAWLL